MLTETLTISGLSSTRSMSLGMVIHNGARIQCTHPDEDIALSGQRLHANRHWKQVMMKNIVTWLRCAQLRMTGGGGGRVGAQG